MKGLAVAPSRRRRAFTFVEVTAIAAIPAVLAGAVVPVYFDRAREAKVAAARYAQGALSTAVLQARMDDVFRGGPQSGRLIDYEPPHRT